MPSGDAHRSLARALDILELCSQNGWQLFMPQLSLCGDNAAMVGAQAYFEQQAGHFAGMALNARPTMSIEAGF